MILDEEECAMIMRKADIKENRLLELDRELLPILLRDNTTKQNLIWATDIYQNKGLSYKSDSYIMPALITGHYGNVIKPRTEKSKKEQQVRVRSKAEVFTPSWVCNVQNNLIDTAWLGYEDAFNTEAEQSWTVTAQRIKFPRMAKKNWKAYVKSIRLEIACGEAPYITSRYDTVSGDYIEVENRIGFLDRKLRVIGENIEDEKLWVEWAVRAVKASYGYDWQGDNVLLARENVLYTVMEFYESKFCKQLELTYIIKLAKIISWNIWQMDGLKFVIPNSCCIEKYTEMTLFGEEEITSACIGCQKNDSRQHNGIYCKIMDWSEQKIIRFVDLAEGG